MPETSEWESSQLDGTLPFDEDVTQFQYRKFIHWEFSLFSLQTAFPGFGLGYTVATGSFRVKIFDPNDVVIFEQKVTLRILVTALIFGSFGLVGIGLFIWLPTSEKIETLIINGQPVTDENPSWKYTIGGQESSEFGTYEVGSGEGATTNAGIIEDWWDSPVYRISIPQGSRWHIVGDSWAYGVSSGLLYQFRSLPGGAFGVNFIDAEIDPIGVMNLAYTDQSMISTRRFDHPYRDPRERAYVIESRDGSVAETPYGWEYIAVRKSNTYEELISIDSLGTLLGREETPEARILWEGQILNPRYIILANGVRITIQNRGGELVMKSSRDDFGGEKVISLVGLSEAFDITEDSSGVIWVTNENGAQFMSSDGGDQWNQAVFIAEE